MKKLLFAALLLLSLLTAFFAAADIELIEPGSPIGTIDLDGCVSIVDYGFASADADGNVTKYGSTLDAAERLQANAEKPLFYITFTNTSDTMQEISLYIRGGRQYDCFWSKTAAILAGRTYTFYGKGHKKAERYAGDWSVDVYGKKIVRFTLETE